MKILIITSSNPTKAAGIVALDLYKGLGSIGDNEVKVLVREYDSYGDKNIIPFENRFVNVRRRIYDKITKFFLRLKFVRTNSNNNTTNLDYFFLDYDQTITYYSTKAILNKVDFKPDAIIILFTQYFLSFKNIFELNQITQAPVFLYLMDMAHLSGGCHYAWDCKSYIKECGRCPALFSEQENDQSKTNWKFKKKYIEKTEISVLAGTEWQFMQLDRSSLFKNKPKHKLLLGIDSEIFKPGNKKLARGNLNLPHDKKIILFGAVYYDRFRNKGFKELITALTILKDSFPESSNIHLAIAGNRSKELTDYLPFENTYLGYLNHKQLSEAFRAADLFVSPSIEDSGPMMINQSIMSGTPVVAFEMGVAIDLVITGQTGYRAKLKDCEDLAKGIISILRLNENEYTNMSDKSRALAISLCHPSVQTKKIMDIINIYKNNHSAIRTDL